MRNDLQFLANQIPDPSTRRAVQALIVGSREQLTK